MTSNHSSRVAICPHCDKPFHYIETRFIGVNDEGYWEIACNNCKTEFFIAIKNPRESSTKQEWQVKRHEDRPSDPSAVFAKEVVAHNIPRDKTNWVFKVDAPPLYVCKDSGANLETSAYDALRLEADGVQAAWANAENWYLAHNGPDHILVRVDALCSCGQSHKASFYAPTFLGASDVPLPERCLLADVEGADLEARLNCLASKTDIMELLEKLIIRWQFTASQILLATPFIGHQYMKPAQTREIWDWLLSMLDPRKALLITRKATWTSFKKKSQKDDVDFEELERYDLEDKIVSTGGSKQDFHAKFFAGVSSSHAEILSGSANLLRGPSIENISFKRVTSGHFREKYVSVLKYPIPLTPPTRTSHDVIQMSEKGTWQHTTLRSLPWN